MSEDVWEGVGALLKALLRLGSLAMAGLAFYFHSHGDVEGGKWYMLLAIWLWL